ncbi:putative membrane protein YczE [Motilibacter peucedani]|uniref:Putative membrane protein YczE n=1 Tax=Motilibacter peucedani TaxID=598650 RepID=A0A420XMQ9_9ACTN|nr:hypothetical protein [Motilibacter peucedani]RKS72556.1 putative membrane protein YczE [Motilibacter peucedani]
MRTTLTWRVPQLVVGLLLYGASDALLVRAGLGLDPWTSLHQGLSERIGLVTNLVGLVVLLLWLPLRRRPGVGTVANVALVGTAMDAALAVLPTPHALGVRVPLLLAGVLLNALATATYVGAGLGSGPRDGLSLGLADRGLTLWRVRTTIEVGVLVTGVLLGGSAGVGTVVYAVAIGPLVHRLLPVLSVPAQTGGANPEPVLAEPPVCGTAAG